MDELIRINYDSERPTVNGRDLHEALQRGQRQGVEGIEEERRFGEQCGHFPATERDVVCRHGEDYRYSQYNTQIVNRPDARHSETIQVSKGATEEG